jgi:hypothetical protein
VRQPLGAVWRPAGRLRLDGRPEAVGQPATGESFGRLAQAGHPLAACQSPLTTGKGDGRSLRLSPKVRLHDEWPGAGRIGDENGSDHFASRKEQPFQRPFGQNFAALTVIVAPRRSNLGELKAPSLGAERMIQRRNVARMAPSGGSTSGNGQARPVPLRSHSSPRLLHSSRRRSASELGSMPGGIAEVVGAAESLSLS